MTFDEYQKKVQSTNLTPGTIKDSGILSITFMDKVLGLVGESGEFADEVKKILRDDKANLTPEKHDLLVKELGDVLWYVSTLADLLEIPLEEVARLNVEKLADRKIRGKLSGSGDNR